MAALATGLLWLVMGLARAVSWLAALTARPVVLGIVLGLGLSFIAEGVKLMQGGPALAIGGAALTFLLLGQPRLPAMLVLLGYGAAAALALDPTLAHDLGSLTPGVRLPTLTIPALTWEDMLTGTLLLAVPQAAHPQQRHHRYGRGAQCPVPGASDQRAAACV